MSELDDFVKNLAKEVVDKRKTETIKDEAMLHRSRVRDETLAAFWKEFRSILSQTLETFNASVAADDATFLYAERNKDGEETIRVEISRQTIFIATLQSKVIGEPRLAFSHGSTGSRRAVFFNSWFALTVDDHGNLSISDNDRRAVSGIEDLVKRALSFMFKG